MATVPKIPVIVDTREQVGHCWEFDAESFTTERAKLETGDYGVRGMPEIACERKTLGDAVSTFFANWQRFRRELYRLAALDFPLIVIECDALDILDHKYESDVEPAAVLGRVNSIMLDHGVPVVFWGRRAVAITLVERWLMLAVKKCGGLPTT